MKPYAVLLSLISLLTLSSCSLSIEDRPIVFDEDRLALSLSYMEERYGITKDTPTINPQMVVLHWTAIPDLEKSFEAFRESRLPNWRPEIAGAGALNVSAHFLIDRDGTIYRLMPEELMARHVIGLNHCAIGVENVGGTEETPLTEAQFEANVELVNYLSKKYPIKYLIGHHEYRLFEDHPLWMEKDSGYRTEKTDPGADFMNRVRAAADQSYEPLPVKP